MLQIDRDCSIFGSMKKFFKSIRKRIRRWRDRRLFMKLVKFYARKTDTAYDAISNANYAFEHIIGLTWAEWILWEYHGIKPSSDERSD